MNKTKIFSLIIVVLLITIGLYGCNKKIKPEQIKMEALEYLHANYSDTFEAILYTSSNWAYDYESIIFTTEKYPNETIEVRAYKNENGVYTFIDNYYHCYMLESAIDYVNSLVPKENVVKVSFQNTIWSDELLGAQSFDEWKIMGKVDADFYIFTEEALTTNVQKEIVNKLVNDKVSGYITFFVTDDENLLQELSLDEILNNHEKYVVSISEYDIIKNKKEN